MTLDSRTGQYTGSIPGPFVGPQWDLMYFVEIVDRQGNGGMYPDLETETPYIVVSVSPAIRMNVTLLQFRANRHDYEPSG
jgi:hypothetical protein